MHLPDSPGSLPRRSVTGRVVRFLITALAIGIAALGAPHVSATNRFELLRQQDLRLATVAYQLATRSPVCRAATAPQLGFTLHQRSQYAPADREEAARHYGLYAHVGVMAVVAGSPADVAGLAANDQLISVNGRALRANSEEPAGKILVDELQKGPVILRVSNSAGPKDVRFAAMLGCASNVELIAGVEVNAWADGERVVVTTAILDKCSTDDQLALVIAHEMGHNLLGHRHDSAMAGGAPSLLPVSGEGSAKGRADEEAADRFAVTMARAAGYDLGQAVPFLAMLLDADGPSARAAPTHPTTKRRLRLLEAAIAAI
ncbi:M48 family metallopeptidase [Sphingomonas sp. M1-B02]|uniref:M48 family metallopeptidase n=1 Tax=Sphingomonas sp. M1-B02 TaxID=3114300 RepID=UPI002240BB8D|nr:M48 family metallopeptidase [Sphingomonas sp. S6-11]UZK65888.1 M48 family metallopeptidase [Sphingomonas sp. S6-11]